MQGAQIALWGYLGACALWAVRKERLTARAVRLAALALLSASMANTIGLTIMDGKDLLRTLLPLHLCSLSAFIALGALVTQSRACEAFLWYLGLPGAAAALIFPAVEPSRWYLSMYTSFFLTHALIVFVPLLAAADGRLPQRKDAGPVFLVGNLMLLVVYGVDRLIDANYMFLRWAPAGTPLVFFERLGRPAYFALIEAGAVIIVLFMRAAIKPLGRRAATQV